MLSKYWLYVKTIKNDMVEYFLRIIQNFFNFSMFEIFYANICESYNWDIANSNNIYLNTAINFKIPMYF